EVQQDAGDVAARQQLERVRQARAVDEVEAPVGRVGHHRLDRTRVVGAVLDQENLAATCLGASDGGGFVAASGQPRRRLLTRPIGTWGYRVDPGARGLARGWRRGHFRTRRVHVPYVPNAWPVTGARGARNYEGSVGWFVRRFRVPRSGRYAIRFESVHHRARV